MKAAILVEKELKKKRNKNKFVSSAHEGYALLLEEMDELWEEVRKKRKLHNKNNMIEEASQIAALAIMFMQDVCDVDSRRKDVVRRNRQ